MHIYSFNDLKFTLKHLKRSYIFRSHDHPQGTYIVPCEIYSLKTLSGLHRLILNSIRLAQYKRHAATAPTQRNDANY